MEESAREASRCSKVTHYNVFCNRQFSLGFNLKPLFSHSRSFVSERIACFVRSRLGLSQRQSDRLCCFRPCLKCGPRRRCRSLHRVPSIPNSSLRGGPTRSSSRAPTATGRTASSRSPSSGAHKVGQTLPVPPSLVRPCPRPSESPGARVGTRRSSTSCFCDTRLTSVDVRDACATTPDPNNHVK